MPIPRLRSVERHEGDHAASPLPQASMHYFFMSVPGGGFASALISVERGAPPFLVVLLGITADA